MTAVLDIDRAVEAVLAEARLVQRVSQPTDLRRLDPDQLPELAEELRQFIVEAVSATGGHLSSNLGVVELTIALHRAFDSPRDIILWDTGHLAYAHKVLTGRRDAFQTLRQAGGLAGYPSRAESEHDWIENSHASTAISYAHGLATAIQRRDEDRKVVVVIGDGAMTGGMAYEGLNNLGHGGARAIVILNDNGRSYAPTVSRLIGAPPEAAGFFEALGVRYMGPIDGHDVPAMEAALGEAALHDGPVLVHVLTQKGRGYRPAEEDEEKRWHDVSAFDLETGPVQGGLAGYTKAFAEAMVAVGETRPEVMAVTAAMPGSTGLLPFQARFPDRFVDAGIAEQHAVTAAAGMAMGGLRPVVAVYSTFFSRAFDQANLDVGLHCLPVVFALDRAGITGDDGPSHNGVLDVALCLKIPKLTVFAPSSAQELAVMLGDALALDGPACLRYPKGAARQVPPDQVGSGLEARRARQGDGTVCILAVGKLVEAAERAASLLETQGIDATVWDARVVSPLDPAMIADAARHGLVVTAEDGIRIGGAGALMADAIAAHDPSRPAPPVLVLGIPREYLPQGSQGSIHARLGLDGPGIAASVAGALEAHGLLPAGTQPEVELVGSPG
ncbi:MAG: 1-deoxy-D-xylulose-5-phosphate synthase [Actinomycetota bacterium]|jgi:1-deoxy-D-xylulose-5-phosphate synthase|nr:1-deoxy-D-xylulose-5-phosphate synthase [Actinomycetota bacterium]